MATIDRDRLLAFMRQERYAVQASVDDEGGPQAAMVGVVVSDRFEVFFDTLGSSGKALRPRWIRFSDFTVVSPHIVEIAPGNVPSGRQQA